MDFDVNDGPAFLDWLKTRRAIRRYLPRPVAPADLELILAAGQWAPSAHNRQPWRLAPLTQPAQLVRLAQALGERLRADRLADGDPPAVIERDIQRSYDRIAGAPAAILVCLSMVDMDTYPDERRNWAEWKMAVQSVAMASQNMWLMAHRLGLGGCWLCAPLFAPAVAQEVLQLPADWQAMGLLTLGYPAEAPQKTRRPLLLP